MDLSDENVTELKLSDQLENESEKEEAAVNTTQQMADQTNDQPTVCGLVIFLRNFSKIFF